MDLIWLLKNRRKGNTQYLIHVWKVKREFYIKQSKSELFLFQVLLGLWFQVGEYFRESHILLFFFFFSNDIFLILDFTSSQSLLLSLAAHPWLTVSISGWLYSQPSLATLHVCAEISPYSHKAKSLNITWKPSKVGCERLNEREKKHGLCALSTSQVFIVGVLAIGRVKIHLKIMYFLKFL